MAKRGSSARRRFLWGLLSLMAAAGAAIGLGIFYSTAPRPQIGLIKVIPDVLLAQENVVAVSEMLSFALQNDSIKGVAVVIDSPGGGAADSEELFLHMLNLRSKKPVVVSTGGIAASGGYLMALGANFIYSKDASILGNIGVIARVGQPELPGEDLVVSGPFKETGLTQTGYLRAIELLKENFVETVISQRGAKLTLSRDQVGDGRIYIGGEALRVGLIDEIGSTQDAIEKAASLAGVKRYRLVDVNKVTRHERFRSFFFFLRGQPSPHTQLYHLYVEPTR